MSDIKLSPRLQTVAGFVRDGDMVADIGCDHALVSAYLMQSGIAKHVYAADVNQKPLSRAVETIKKHQLQNGVSLVLSDGLQAVPPEVDTVLIAGMGGELIIDILRQAKWLKNPCKRLVLQPMSFAEKLRSYLWQEGFFIKEEIPVFEDAHVYTVLCASYSGEIKHMPYWKTLLGCVDLQKNEGKRYLQKVLDTQQHILNGMKCAKLSASQHEEQQKLVDKLIKIQEEIK